MVAEPRDWIQPRENTTIVSFVHLFRIIFQVSHLCFSSVSWSVSHSSHSLHQSHLTQWGLDYWRQHRHHHRRQLLRWPPGGVWYDVGLEWADHESRYQSSDSSKTYSWCCWGRHCCCCCCCWWSLIVSQVTLSYKSKMFCKGAPGRFVYVCKYTMMMKTILISTIFSSLWTNHWLWIPKTWKTCSKTSRRPGETSQGNCVEESCWPGGGTL